MTELRFERDWRKATANEAKHGVRFAEAVTVFDDERGLLVEDPDHSDDEERFILTASVPGNEFSWWYTAIANRMR